MTDRDPYWYEALVERHRAQIMVDLVPMTGADAALVLQKLSERLAFEAKKVKTSKTGSWRAP